MAEEQNLRLWKWLGKEPEGDLTTDLNLCFKVFPAKLGMADDEKQIMLTFVQYEEGFFENGITWHCWGAVEDAIGSFMEGYGTNPAMAFCGAMDDFFAGEGKNDG